MRRVSLASAAIYTSAVLAGCGGGGSVLSFTSNATPDHVIITVGGPSNIARVLPGASLALTALPVTGSQNGVLSNNHFIWSAMLTSGGTYVADSAGHTKPCATVSLTSGGTTTPYTADFSVYLTIDPTNEANVILTPPTTIPPPAGGTIATNYPYCVVVTAQTIGSNLQPGKSPVPLGPPGSITAAVVDPQNPLP